MLPDTFFWAAMIGSGSLIAGFICFCVQVLRIRKLQLENKKHQLENEKLEYEKKQRESAIHLPTAQEIERYGRRRPSGRLWGIAFVALGCASWISYTSKWMSLVEYLNVRCFECIQIMSRNSFRLGWAAAMCSLSIAFVALQPLIRRVPRSVKGDVTVKAMLLLWGVVLVYGSWRIVSVPWVN